MAASTDLSRGYDFFTPFVSTSEGSVTAPASGFFPVTLANHDYVIDLNKYERQTLQQFRDAQDPSREPGEQTLTVEGVWKRTQERWHHGAGQEFADDTDSDRLRYWSSKGVDPWDVRRLCLLHDTDQSLVSAATNLHLTVASGQLVVAENTAVKACPTPGAVSPVWTDQTIGSTTTIEGIGSDGTTIYAAAGGGGLRGVVPGSPPGSVVVTGSSPGPGIAVNGVWFVSGWLVVASGPSIYTVAVGDPWPVTPTLVWTPDHSDIAWVGMTGAPNAIYAAANIGDRAVIYRIEVDDTGAALKVPVFAGDLPLGETVHSILYYLNTVVIGTSRGVRIARIGSDGSLSIGPVIDIGHTVYALTAYGQYVWFGWSTYDNVSSGLGRLDLQTETSTLVPAYASDLMVTSQAEVVSAIHHQGSLYFSIAGSGVWGEADTYLTTGELVSGWFGLGSPERKVLSTASVLSEPLPTGASCDLVGEDDANTEFTLGSHATTNARASEEFDGQGLDSELLRYTLRLYSDGDASPCMRRATFRMVIAPRGVEEIIVPILIADRVADGIGGRSRRFPPFDEFRYLKSLEASRQVVDYREGQVTYRVTIRNVRMEKPDNWSHRRRFFDGLILVRLLTLEGVPPEIGSE